MSLSLVNTSENTSKDAYYQEFARLLSLLKGFLTKVSSHHLYCVALQKICNEVHPGAEGTHDIQASLGCRGR